MSETIISIEHVSKEYRLGAIGGTTLREDIQRLGARILGKEDPTMKIGAQSGQYNERFLALDDISFDVKKGEALGIIGHNGAGKSTLLKLLSRVTAPTKGRISFNGRIASMLEVGTGFHPELTGRENVYMNGAILGMTKAEIDRKFDEIVAFAEMEQFIDTPVKRYSSGMYVKLAFSVAAHLDSEIMIMDEVLAVGDMAFQNKCLEKMRDASQQEGRTVLYVSHNMNTIRQLCSRCIVLDRGKVVFNGAVEHAIDKYLSKSNENSSTCVDLSESIRPNNSLNLVKMNYISFLEKKDCIFRAHEPIYIRLNWTSMENLDDVRFRMIVRSYDDSPVGLVVTEPICNTVAGNNYTTEFLFEHDLLANGRYYLSIALYQSDDSGKSQILDHISRACSFELLSDIEDGNILVWEHRWWGMIKFPEMKIIKRG
ncbi:MAG: ABC transporter ATP-binding protein [Clostridiales bacterium]|nr:ABC transporter ATP-binding protein [Clostridiales bacterium]